MGIPHLLHTEVPQNTIPPSLIPLHSRAASTASAAAWEATFGSIHPHKPPHHSSLSVTFLTPFQHHPRHCGAYFCYCCCCCCCCASCCWPSQPCAHASSAGEREVQASFSSCSYTTPKGTLQARKVEAPCIWPCSMTCHHNMLCIQKQPCKQAGAWHIFLLMVLHDMPWSHAPHPKAALQVCTLHVTSIEADSRVPRC